MSGVISKAIRVLDMLLPHGEEKELSVTEISKRLEMPVQSVHRILSSLREHGFVARNSQTRKYKLGLSLMKYGSLMRDSLLFRSVAQPYMQELSRATKETVYLASRENDEGVYVDAIDSPQFLKISEPIGLRLPLVIGASNRVILAFLPAKTQEELLRKVDWRNVPSLKPLTREYVLADLETIRKQGFATTTGEATEGTTGIAAPIFSYERQVIGSLNVAGPAIRFQRETMERNVVLAKKFAELISREMGY
ncbi:IclR family transcriptional regulator [Paenibacillus cymbidii]|uniref:IclR family transcriptional regulator n=1 Tax=Paenibacillus cymbidii TaxID=1639034 RepID=UPI0010822560|nr:IclR family transcriptional regulator [Paenibacillus cymbidii]